MRSVSMIKRACVTAFAVSAAALGLPAVAAEAVVAGPVAITCGATISSDAYLAADLVCPTGDGVRVTANATLDLGGHHLTGSRAGAGVVVKYGASVRLQHGRLSGWGTGLTVRSAELHPQSVAATIVVYAMNFVGNGTAVSPGAVQGSGDTSPTVAVSRSYFTANDIGVGGVVDNSATTVTRSTFWHNRTAVSFVGDVFTDTGSVVMDSSLLTGNTRGVLCAGSFCILKKNTLRGNATGVEVQNMFTFLTMAGNTVTGSTVGVDSEGNRVSELTANTFSYNKTAVSYQRNGGKFVGNTLSHNGTAFTMVAGDLFPGAPVVPVSGNTITQNTGNGITVSGVADVRDNIVTGNGGYGIFAPQSTDSGGNHASGNISTPQCVGVTCAA